MVVNGNATTTSATARAWPEPGRGLAGSRSALRSALARFAAGAPTRVFVLEGIDAPDALDVLRLRSDITFVDTPRSATVLLVAGRLPEAMHEVARRAHDAMAEPRATVWWTLPPDHGAMLPFPDATVVNALPDGSSDAMATLAGVLARTQAGLLCATRPSEAALLADVDPAPWRGVGPYGQGGSGMTGGVPYGRPLAGRAPDRDGLELDQLSVRVGPFFAPFPAGLVLDVTLQGDIIQEAIVPGNPFVASGDDGNPVRVTGGAFHAVLREPVRIADLERARARHHLRWLARALRVHGLEALGLRTLALATTLADGVPPGAVRDVGALRRLLERTRGLGWATAEVGVIDPRLVTGRGLGPIARAAGLAEDARIDDPAYDELGFAPVMQERDGNPAGRAVGDARARWRQRLGETMQSLALAARAGDRRTGGEGRPVEGVRGRVSDATRDSPSAMLLALLPDLLRGQEWGDAVTTIVSLDIDVREAALAPGAAPLRPPPASQPGGGMDGMAGMPGMPGMGDHAPDGQAKGGM